MTVLIKGVRVIDIFADIDVLTDVYLAKGNIDLNPKQISPSIMMDGKDLILMPGLIDLHVHFREPGFKHKEDIASGIKAALAGGVTSALVMPNTNPPIDSFKRVRFQMDRAFLTGFDLMVAAAASINLEGCKPTDINNLSKAKVFAITDDGRPILDTSLMVEVLRRCRLNNLVCMQHAEDLHISHNAPLHDGKISERFNMVGQPASAESSLIARDIALAETINARYHVLHLSCVESLKLVQAAKRRKALVTCEVTPHHLMLNECDVRNLDTRKKMNPPLRSKNDVIALCEGLFDGSIDAVASDHAPHAKKEKNLPFDKAPFGVVGLESAILVLMTLVKTRGLPLKRAISLMTTGPARILGEPWRRGTMIKNGALKNAVLIDPYHRSLFSERNLNGRSTNSPFIGMEMFGKVKATFIDGEMMFREQI